MALGVEILAIAAIATLAFTIYKEHFYRPEGVSRKNPPRTRLVPIYSCTMGSGCRIKELTMIAENVARIDLETPGGEKFTETRHRMDLECDIFQVMAGHEPPIIKVKDGSEKIDYVGQDKLRQQNEEVRKDEKKKRPTSNVLVELKCDGCGREFERLQPLTAHRRFCKGSGKK